jgi:hypothetical protein
MVSFFLGAALAAFCNSAQAQRIDFAFGVSNAIAPDTSGANGVDHLPVSLSGGAYPGFSGNVIFFHNVGAGAEIFWRGSQGNYAGQGTGFRPLFWDVNAVYSPKLAPHAYLELVAGIGALSSRFYCGLACFNPYTGSNYVSSNHFDGDFGGGIKLYVGHGFFIRPEARFYVIHNNLEFSSNHAARAGVSIGYTFK